MASIFVAAPCYGYQVSAKNFGTLVQNLFVLEQAGVESELFFLGGESLITRARNSLCAEFLGSKHTHLCFVDGDLEFESEAILKLLNNKQHCSVALYEDEGFQGRRISKDMVIPCAPLGLSLISREGIEKLVSKFPERKYKNDMKSYENERTKDNFYNFFGSEIKDGCYNTDYATFCSLWNAVGLKVHVVPDITITHLKKRGVPMNLQAMLEKKDGRGVETTERDASAGKVRGDESETRVTAASDNNGIEAASGIGAAEENVGGQTVGDSS